MAHRKTAAMAKSTDRNELRTRPSDQPSPQAEQQINKADGSELALDLLKGAIAEGLASGP
jgi:hypothetical protein